MDTNTIRQLAATPPPAHRLWKFKTARTAHAEINRLESLLGMSPSRLDFNLTAANARIRELEAMAAPVVAHRTAPPAAATPQIGLAELTALHSLIFGIGETESVLRNHANFSHGSERYEAAIKAADDVRARFGSNSKDYEIAAEKKHLTLKAIRLEREGSETEKIGRLAQSFLTAGLVVPGLSAAGLDMKIDLRNPSAGQFPDRERALAQDHVNTFIAGIGGQPEALSASNCAAKAARKYLIENRPAGVDCNFKLTIK